MTSVFGRSRLFFGFVGLISVVSMDASAAPLISLKAIELNGSTITPTNSISVAPGDVIKAELFLSDWTTTLEKLVTFTTGVARASLIGGSRGTVLPLGWDAPILFPDEIPCAVDADCPAEFPVCQLSGVLGTCVGLNHDPSQGVFIGSPGNVPLPSRPDWVFLNPTAFPPASFGALTATDVGGPPLRFTGVLILGSDAQLYTAPPKYLGTLILKVSDDACGRFSLRLLANQTELLDQSSVPICNGVLEPVCNIVREGLTITVTSPGAPAGSGDCSCLNIVGRRYDGIDVTNCTIDARQPKDPDGTNPQIPNSVTFTFDCSDTTGIANTSQFTNSFAPNAFFGIGSVTPNGSDVTVALQLPMAEKKWNCVTFTPTGEGACIGIMPGDVNSDSRSLAFDCGAPGQPACPGGTVGQNDILALIDCLNAPGACTVFQCDSNRSGACGPQDILRVIDLLNGAGNFTSYNAKGILSFSQQIVACPLAP